MKDLAKKEFLDNKAKLEFGTQVQFFKFDFDDVVQFTTIITLITLILIYFTPMLMEYIIGGFTGAFLLLLFFYFKIGTN